MENGKTVIFSSSSLSKQPTAQLVHVGPETMIHSPNCFALSCAGFFHKVSESVDSLCRDETDAPIT